MDLECAIFTVVVIGTAFGAYKFYKKNLSDSPDTSGDKPSGGGDSDGYKDPRRN